MKIPELQDFIQSVIDCRREKYVVPFEYIGEKGKIEIRFYAYGSVDVWVNDERVHTGLSSEEAAKKYYQLVYVDQNQKS